MRPNTEGWVKLWRSALDHPCLTAFDEMGVWVTLLMRAYRSEGRASIKGVTETLRRGQAPIVATTLAAEGGIERKRLRTIMAKLRANQMIEWVQAKGQAFTIVTICNFDKYQSSAEARGQAEGQAWAKEGPSSGPTSIRRRIQEGENLPPEAPIGASCPPEGGDAPVEPEVASPVPEAGPEPEPEPKPRAKAKAGKPPRHPTAGYPDAFEAVWRTYPLREEDKPAKRDCYKHWRSAVMDGSPPAAIVAGAVAWSSAVALDPYRFGLRRWLKDRMFERPPPVRPAPNGHGEPAEGRGKHLGIHERLMRRHGLASTPEPREDDDDEDPFVARARFPVPYQAPGHG